MLNKLRFSLRIQMITIALCLLMTSSVLGLSAYLTDVDDSYRCTFRTVSDLEMGFSIIGNTYENEPVIPGGVIPLNAAAIVTKEISLYIFIKVDLSAELDSSSFNTDDWHLVDGYVDVYYYGTDANIVSTESNSRFKCSIIDKIKLSEDAKTNGSYNLDITGYAIQADNLSSTLSPQAIYEMIASS